MKCINDIRFLPCLHWYFLKEIQIWLSLFSRCHCNVIAVHLRMNLLLIELIWIFFFQGWIQYSGSSCLCGASWIYRPQPGSGTQVTKYRSVDYAAYIYLISSCHCDLINWVNFFPCSMQTVLMEFPVTGWSSENWSNDGGFCPALLSMQSWCLSIHRFVCVCNLIALQQGFNNIKNNLIFHNFQHQNKK